MIRRILLPVALLLLAVPLLGQTAEGERGMVRGFAVDTIDIVQSQPLSFGGITAGVTGGAITISWDGMRTAAGVVPFGAAGYGASSFLVTMTGNGNPHFTITLPSTTTLSGPGTSMQVDTFQVAPEAGLVDPRTKQQIFTIGATLTVGSMQAPGTYSGQYNVTVHLGN